MRNAAALSLVILVACGGAEKPASSPADTSSLEPKGSGADAPAAAAEEPAPKAPATPQAAPATSSAAAASPASAPAAEAPAAGHPTPSATGSIDGKPFSPKIARSKAAMQKDGRLLLSLTEATDCASSPKPGEGTLTLLVDWKDGYKTDLASLKRATRPGAGEVGFSRAGGGLSKTFKPSGRLTVVSAPTDANATGKIKVDLQSGAFMLAGDLDVLLCVAAK